MCVFFTFHSTRSPIHNVGNYAFKTAVTRNLFFLQRGCLTSFAPAFYQTTTAEAVLNTTTTTPKSDSSNKKKSATINKTNFCVFNSIFTRNFTTTTNMSAKPCVTMDNINPNIKLMEYAVSLVRKTKQLAKVN